MSRIQLPRRIPDGGELQESLQDFAKQFSDSDHLLGGQINDVEIGTTETEVAHKLGRKPIGWYLVDQNADATVWRSSESTTKFLKLTASAAVTVSIRVY